MYACMHAYECNVYMCMCACMYMQALCTCMYACECMIATSICMYIYDRICVCTYILRQNPWISPQVDPQNFLQTYTRGGLIGGVTYNSNESFFFSVLFFSRFFLLHSD
jgi:hypothetical protein